MHCCAAFQSRKAEQDGEREGKKKEKKSQKKAENVVTCTDIDGPWFWG